MVPLRFALFTLLAANLINKVAPFHLHRVPRVKTVRYSKTNSEDKFSIPIVPLPKILLPTSTCSLNLYEPRYLSMLDSIMATPGSKFGAFYSGASPKVTVPPTDESSTETSTPIMQPGDIGVICKVINSEESETRDGERMVKVKGLAVSRFKVESVQSTGYDCLMTGEGGEPYIICDCSTFNDLVPSPEEVTDINKAENKLWTTLKSLESLVDSIWCASSDDSEEDECNLSVHRFAPTDSDDRGALERAFHKQQAECDVDGDGGDCTVDSEDRTFLFSMAVSASLTELEQSDQLALLRTRSLLKRLRRCERVVNEAKSWIAARKGLSDLSDLS